MNGNYSLPSLRPHYQQSTTAIPRVIRRLG